MNKQYREMLKIHKRTEEFMKNEQWYFEHPEMMPMRIRKPKIMTTLFSAYGKNKGFELLPKELLRVE